MGVVKRRVLRGLWRRLVGVGIISPGHPSGLRPLYCPWPRISGPPLPGAAFTLRTILDGDTALGQWREIMREMMDAAGPAV